MIISRSIDLRIRTVSEKVVERINPLNAELNPICQLLGLLGTHHILHVSRIRVKNINSMFDFFFENHAFYEVTWKNIVEQGRPQMTIWHMRTASTATNTHSEYVIHIVFSLQQWLKESTSMLR